MHQTAARGFATAGESYERGRPDYPPEAIAALVEHLRLRPGLRVIDAGAGTGKLTRRLRECGADVLAVEPVAGMRETFARALPGVPLVGATAERLPLRDGVAGAIVAGTAFHWFDGVTMLREAHRVLHPGGRLGLVWLARDETVEWVARLVALVAEYKRGDPPRYDDWRWKAAFDHPDITARFTPLEEARFPFAHVADRATAIARVSSTSFVGTLDEREKAEVLQRVTALLDTHPETRERETLALPYRADVYWCAGR